LMILTKKFPILLFRKGVVWQTMINSAAFG